MERTLRPGVPLTSVLATATRVCEEKLSGYLEAAPSAPNAVFRNTVSFALAVMRASADHAEPAAIDLPLLRDAARDAADACRRHGIDESLLGAAAAFDSVVAACDEALRPRGL